ncbi:MAG: response regulator [Granulosicoccus sp.]
MPMTANRQHACKQVEFLIIDDDEVSVMAIQRSMKKLDLNYNTHTAKNGVEALEILKKSIGSDNLLPPIITTLDLNMPKMGGLEFLKQVRDDPVLSKLVVFVITTSDASTDIASAYEKNVAGYIIKGNTSDISLNVVALLRDYAQISILPC